MKLRQVCISHPRLVEVDDICPRCRANLLAPGALRCRVLVDVQLDQLTHQDDHPRELEWTNLSGNYFGDLREPLEWQCGACETVICPASSPRSWLLSVADALLGR